MDYLFLPAFFLAAFFVGGRLRPPPPPPGSPVSVPKSTVEGNVIFDSS
jgi:hypothetical protein